MHRSNQRRFALSAGLFNTILATPPLRALHARLEGNAPLTLSGVNPPAQPFLAVLLHRLLPGRPIVVVTEGLKAQERFAQDIETWMNFGSSDNPDPPKPNNGAARRIRPLFFPAWEILPNEARLPHADIVSERLETLVELARSPESNEPAHLVVTNVAALLQRTLPREFVRDHTREISTDDRIDPLDLVDWLEQQGYEPEAQVNQKGEIALRGGILDVYPLTSPWPVRIEFFGDEIESLRHFDPITQISREPITRIAIPPAGEIGILKKLAESAGIGGGVTLLDHLPARSLVLICEPETVEKAADQYAGQVPAGDPLYLSWQSLLQQLQDKKMVQLAVEEASTASLDSLDSSPVSDEESEFPLNFSSLDPFRPIVPPGSEPQIAEAQRREFFVQLHRWRRQGYAVHLFCNNAGEQQRFVELWQEYGLDRRETDAAATNGAGSDGAAPDSFLPSTHIGALSQGFIHETSRTVVVTDAEIFGRYKVQRPRRLKSPHAAATRSALDIDFTDLQPGDYVVHLQHGIGRYLGLQVLPMGAGRQGQNGSEPSRENGQECLVLEYAPSDPDQPPPKLYVPVTEAHLVGKYVGAGKARPSLNTLGGTRWAKTKAQAEKAVRDLAGELLSIQAARESQPGHAFPPDTPWQREFESAFLYEETPDQLRAIAETKRDMETPKPMDRLICGDVGFGKTEVAIRAAFKAVLGGRQVAVLVPTTILAQQHFNTFRERMADYPIRVEQLSRFRTRSEQKAIVRQLAEGGIDIVVGTHRLLQNDIAFKDLGLVIIDEEQRFGVLHKEKFKRLRRLVDVLTLSATPIPRTLYLALTGARDMSTIETPPQDRLPVETIVTQFDERVIRDAIQRELNRGGQVYYLHNRVQDIDTVALRIKALVPGVRLLVGHGQMESDELEEVMARFINGEADVLVSTTIIESGIDIPNANTIIIDRADRFGLSDLYQLRGRVGRYKHQAYAYLLLPRHATLLKDVRKRISAIKQYSSLGSGFKIAMRDLEIRGAGNLLGPEQSGHITAVGFELYCQLLKQSVAALKGEKIPRRIDVQLRLDFLAFHPGEESRIRQEKSTRSRKKSDPVISVPREVASAWSPPDVPESGQTENSTGSDIAAQARAAAYIPFDYISESHQRIMTYRKLAQAVDKAGLDELRAELRDRFGKLPPAMELLLLATELKCLAASKGIVAIETKQDKLMLMRNNDYITVGGKFPRLTRKEPSAKLQEIKRLLLSL